MSTQRKRSTRFPDDFPPRAFMQGAALGGYFMWMLWIGWTMATELWPRLKPWNAAAWGIALALIIIAVVVPLLRRSRHMRETYLRLREHNEELERALKEQILANDPNLKPEDLDDRRY